MARRIVVEVSDEEYHRLLLMSKLARKADPERLKGYTWKQAAQEAMSDGITADWEYGSYDVRESRDV